MMPERTLEIIKTYTNRLKKPVRLVLFTSERGCAACPDMLGLVQAIKADVRVITATNRDIEKAIK